MSRQPGSALTTFSRRLLAIILVFFFLWPSKATSNELRRRRPPHVKLPQSSAEQEKKSPLPRVPLSHLPNGGRTLPPLYSILESTPSISQQAASTLPPLLESWISKGNLATAAGLDPITEINIPIRINLLMLGFDGNGANGVDLSHDLLRSWLEHLDHRAIHQHVIRSTGPSTTSTPPPTPLPPQSPYPVDIIYNYRYDLLILSPLALTVVEKTLESSFRDDTESSYQIDPRVLNNVFSSLLSYLQLDQTSYTIIILNPKSEWRGNKRYGYREGLSNDEIEEFLLAASSPASASQSNSADADEPIEFIQLKEFIQKLKVNPNITWSAAANKFNPDDFTWSQPIEQAGFSSSSPLSSTDLSQESEKWANSLLSTYSYSSGPLSLLSYLSYLSYSSPLSILNLLSNPYLLEDCLVDSWISNTNRLIWLDLSAGPFKWGPTIGGNGVKTEYSFPSTLGLKREKLETKVTGNENDNNNININKELVVSGDISEDEIGDQDNLHDIDTIQAEKLLVLDRIKSLGCGSRSNRELRGEYEETCRIYLAALKEIQEIEIALTNNRTIPTLYNPASNNNNDNNPNNSNNNNPDISLNPFNFLSSHQDSEQHGITFEIHQQDHFLSHLSSIIINAIAHIITPITSIPPNTHTSINKQKEELDNENENENLDEKISGMNGNYYSSYHFDIYFLQNHDHSTRSTSTNSNSAFSIDDNTHFLQRLKYSLLPIELLSESFSFSIKSVSLVDDIEIGMAYYTSLESSVLPTLLADGHYTAIKRIWLDSLSIQSQLNKKSNLKKKSSGTKSSKKNIKNPNINSEKTIPIFIFSLDFPVPILLDEHYQSILLLDNEIILGIQSNLHLIESQLQCNNQAIYLNLNDPLKSILFNIINLMAGIVYWHEGITNNNNQNNNNNNINSNIDSISNIDWKWSLGTSLLSHTSNGIEISLITIDTIHRMTILNNVISYINLFNHEIDLLKKEKIGIWNSELAGITHTGENITATSTYNSNNNNNKWIESFQFLSLTYERILSQLEILEALISLMLFESAIDEMNDLIKHIEKFIIVSKKIRRYSKKNRCEGKVASVIGGRRIERENDEGGLSIVYYLITVIACLSLVLHRLLFPIRPKAKLN